MVTEVTQYITKGGKHFDDADEAERMETLEEFAEYMDEHPIYGDCAGCKVYYNDLVEWLNGNEQAQFYMQKLLDTV